MYLRFVSPVLTGIVLEQYWVTASGCKHHKATSECLQMPYDRNLDVEDFEEWQWSTNCVHCEQRAPDYAVRSVKPGTVYNTRSGHLEPGNLYWNTDLPEDYFWNDHRGPHLCVVAPNGFRWILDSRAQNCRRPGNHTHRCWPWYGDPELGNITVLYDKRSCIPAATPPLVSLGNWTGTLLDGNMTEITTDHPAVCPTHFDLY